MNTVTGLVVAMDGPSGSGKSSASRGVARALGLRYLDTGAMYRAITWWMLRQEVDLADPAAIAARALDPVLVMGTDPDAPAVTVDGADAAAPIRTAEVTAAVSAVSAVPEVRRRLVAEQREIIGAGGIVVEGRDIGTVVAPEAPVKIYLTASADARAARRTAELAGTTVEAQKAAMARRDTLDSTRKTDPLAMASDAVELDTTALNLEEVIAEVLRLIKEKV
ncbi:cytidylate kinase [Planomonospora parontospora subsp. parontospora]|uniref:Cytidylate kinase n=2 Tax=Planomonospora parontospora TaxID=58119 RepID=A0AA37F2G9_9ACTN|nr:(d)CMP kinase [Planomonospora parontospora]GGK48817.1 cytidylate kinase [Planomonospora parontospora]GII06748.1 cytidylate kinase [Planomonospora parontospora subsp. parontospora]